MASSSKKSGTKKSGTKKSGTKAWSLLSAASAMVATTAAKKFIDGSWRAATGKRPPQNPADPEVKTREAVVFAVFSGAVAALIKMLATRKAADYYARSTGRTPSGKALEASDQVKSSS